MSSPPPDSEQVLPNRDELLAGLLERLMEDARQGQHAGRGGAGGRTSRSARRVA